MHVQTKVFDSDRSPENSTVQMRVLDSGKCVRTLQTKYGRAGLMYVQTRVLDSGFVLFSTKQNACFR